MNKTNGGFFSGGDQEGPNTYAVTEQKAPAGIITGGIKPYRYQKENNNMFEETVIFTKGASSNLADLRLPTSQMPVP